MSMDTIKIPSVKQPHSALDGIYMDAIDTDPAENLSLMLQGFLTGLPQQRRSLLAVIPMVFHGKTPGYLVISSEPAKGSKP